MNYQLLIVTARVGSGGVHSTIASFPTQLEADVACSRIEASRHPFHCTINVTKLY